MITLGLGLGFSCVRTRELWPAPTMVTAVSFKNSRRPMPDFMPYPIKNHIKVFPISTAESTRSDRRWRYATPRPSAWRPKTQQTGFRRAQLRVGNQPAALLSDRTFWYRQSPPG